ncbi:peritrophin-1 [Monomorium pharaonis]|uniref:peritrophin-1 n=1 Tax=Monomorium pharaonis TaxID=307658 RepID=UPI00063EE000|nr:peritrophin-1 [Monomorium pharaonis]
MRGHYTVIVAALIFIAIKVSARQIPRKAFIECPPSETVKLPYPEDCTPYYYVCKDGNGTLNKCPNGMHFNKDIIMCDFPTAECLALTTPPTINPTTASTKPPTDSPNPC